MGTDSESERGTPEEANQTNAGCLTLLHCPKTKQARMAQATATHPSKELTSLSETAAACPSVMGGQRMQERSAEMEFGPGAMTPLAYLKSVMASAIGFQSGCGT